MKVLIYFSGRLNESKGTPIRTRNQIRQLMKNGMDVYYAGHGIPEGFSPDRVLMLAPPLARFRQLARFVRDNGIDIVYIQTSAGIWYAPWLRFFTAAKIGIDFHSRRYQEERVYKNRTKALTVILELTELLLARSLHFGTAVAYTIREYYLHAVPVFLVLPVGVDTKLFSPEVRPREDIVAWKGDSVLLGYAGNTKWYQGVEGALEAFREVISENPGVFKFLIIVSSGSEDVLDYARRHGIEKDIMLLDKQPHAEIPRLLAAADILTVVRPSDLVTEYSFPSKIPEYLALGKALIVSRVSDIGSYIIDRENGMLIPAGDGKALRDALIVLQDAPLREKVAKNARALAVEKFDLDMLGKKLSDFLVSLP